MHSINGKVLETLFKKYSNDLYTFAFYYTRNPEISEDLVQKVFLLACEKIKDIPRDKHQAWLYSTMRNHIHTYHRRKAMHPEVPLEEDKILDRLSYEMEPPVSVERLFPEDLKESSREILRLRALEGQSYAEIARRLGISEDTARQRYSRASKTCRELLAQKKFL